jgi:hypothetical protein
VIGTFCLATEDDDEESYRVGRRKLATAAA